ncbi:ParB/RepB/Spo0J family partition protein [Massilia sp. DD77]|uniref:ParB/RepB/Spo0J family partition protein n=1 Tax=Massilia sp. DD77 TaxID=3109349 RepID=UPI002FFE8465
MTTTPSRAMSVDAIAESTLSNGGEYGEYELGKIRKSPDNRKRFNQDALNELAASIKAMGVAQPILIRPVMPTPEQPEEFEIVAGERRYRASTIAGMSTIPAVCRQLNDLDAAKIRILENLQREDPHPIEEAEGYQLLMLQHGYNADQLADEVKKSRAYIYGRLKLCALTPEVREQFLDDKISASTALLIARIPVPSLQVKALGEILNPPAWQGSEPLSYRKAVEHIQSRYMLDLSAAIFKLNDGKLLAAVGSCVKCPKRTGNQPEIFAGLSADVCTDPDCFAEKKAAHHTAAITQANKKGIPVYEGDEAKTIRDKRWDKDSDLVTADLHITRFERNAPSTKNEGYVKDYLNAEALELVGVAAYLRDPNGEATPYYRRSDIQIALENVGACETEDAREARLEEIKADPSKAPPKTAHQIKWEKEQEEREAAEAVAEKESAYRLTVYKKLRQQASLTGLSLPSLREYVKAVLDQFHLTESVQELYEVDLRTDGTNFIDTADTGTLQLLLLDIMLGETLEASWYDIKSGNADEDGFQAIVSMARHEGIDVAAVRAEIFPPKPEAAPLADRGGADIGSVAVRYRHPSTPSQTWTGRGRQPLWVSEWIKSGNSLSDLEVTLASAETDQVNESAPAETPQTPIVEPEVAEAPNDAPAAETPIADTASADVAAITPEIASSAPKGSKRKPAPAAKRTKLAPPKVSDTESSPSPTAAPEPGPWPFPKSSTIEQKPAKTSRKKTPAAEVSA